MRRFTVTAPAKINLFLHVMGKRADGYHLLDSLVVFARDVSDTVIVEPASGFSFDVSGPFARALQESGEEVDNLVLRAARLFSKETGKPLACSIHLEKNIPLGAGLGGGSADAAATVRALEQFYGIMLPEKEAALLSLGADVPVCYQSVPCRFQGIGDKITGVPSLPCFYALLVWPMQNACTKTVFKNRPDNFRQNFISFPETFESLHRFVSFLEETTNDLQETAETLYPVVGAAQDFLEENTLLSRMSGSGSTVFGIFESEKACQEAHKKVSEAHPEWWMKTTMVR